MALSRSTIQKGQFPKVCELCEVDIKITWKCVNCNLLMCSKCKDKVHSKIKSADKHKIIDIKEVGQHSEEWDLSNIKCEGHKGQSCVMFCKSCDHLVCPQCIAKEHHGHRFLEISEGYKIQIDNVKGIQQQIKSQIEELTNGESEIRSIRKNENSKYTETRNQIQAQNAALKRLVDKYTEKLIKELDMTWKAINNSMDEEENKVTAMKTRKEDQSKQVEDIINSHDAVQVFKECKAMGKLVKEAMEPVKLNFITIPKFLPGEITEDNFGSLQHILNGLVLKIHQQFRTVLDGIGYLSTCPDNSLWLGNPNEVQRVNLEGSNLKVMSNFNMEVYGMAVTPSNDLLLVTKEPSRLKQISGSSGQVTDSVFNVKPLTLTTVHVTSDYKVMVGAGQSGREVVIRMNKKGKQEKTYEHDRNKKQIFTYVKHITTTTNGTIFVVDKLSEDGRGRVVVLGQDSDVINTYTGHPKINSDAKPFKPRCIVTTPLDNNIVTQLNLDIIHILNSVGDLITYYNTENIGILRPFSLSFTRSGQLYIGCSRAVGSTDKGKLYQVETSPI